MDLKTLAGKIALGVARPSDYTDWAERMLEEGAESESVAILAGLGLEREPDSEEVRAYFQRSLRELGIEPVSEENGLLYYARTLCGDIVEGNLAPRVGLSRLDELYPRSDYDPLYNLWDGLSEDVWMVDDGEAPMFNSGLSRDNVERYIVDTARQFLRLTELDLPENFFRLGACRNCGHIGEYREAREGPRWTPDWLFRIVHRGEFQRRIVCAKCGEPYPLTMRDYAGRERYLDSRS